jgi:mannose-binding lectin 2
MEAQNSWTECFSVNNVRLPTNYHFGFTAATSELSDIHDIISVHTYRLDSTEQRLAEDRKNIIPSAPPANIGDTDANTSTAETYWSAFIFFLLISILIISCLCGIRVFSKNTHRYQKSRLY